MLMSGVGGSVVGLGGAVLEPFARPECVCEFAELCLCSPQMSADLNYEQ